jgi:hypothetical protein
MPLSTFERFLPWSGAIAGLAWVAQDALNHFQTRDTPGGTSAEAINDHVTANIGSLACLVLMTVSLLFFATAVRNLLRSGEAREATYSSIAYSGWIIVAAALGQMVVWDYGVLAAADNNDQSATQILGYTWYFGWAGMAVGIGAAFLAMGLGGVRNAVLPRWFARTTIVMGALALLGVCHIPPGGLVSYLLLPFWLVAAAVIVARRQKAGAQPPLVAPAAA